MYRGRLTVITAVALSLFLIGGCGAKPEDVAEQPNVNTIEQGLNENTQTDSAKESKTDVMLDKKEQIDKKTEEKKETPPKAVISKTGYTYNQKFSWSIIRKKDNLPPGLEVRQKELADKYKAVYLGDTSKKIIYLTFDEGYENGYTPKILDVLKENDVKAAFFITKPYLVKEYALVDRMVKEGHIVGNHTVNHPSMPEVLDDYKLEQELIGLDSIFKEKTNLSMKYLRPPKGEFSERTLKLSKELGYTNVFWSFAYADWDRQKQQGAEHAYKMVIDNIHNGAVLLLHAVSKDNAEALDSIIKDLKTKGYSFGMLDDIEN